MSFLLCWDTEGVAELTQPRGATRLLVTPRDKLRTGGPGSQGRGASAPSRPPARSLLRVRGNEPSYASWFLGSLWLAGSLADPQAGPGRLHLGRRRESDLSLEVKVLGLPLELAHLLPVSAAACRAVAQDKEEVTEGKLQASGEEAVGGAEAGGPP